MINSPPLGHIAHVITGLESGGAERMLSHIVACDALVDVRQSVFSLTNDSFFGDAIRYTGARVESLGLRPGDVRPEALRGLVSSLRTTKPDIVMTWLYHADLAGTIAAITAAVPPRRIVWNIRCSDIDFSRYSWKTRLVVHALAGLSRLPGAIACNSQAGMSAHRALGYRPRRWVYLPNGFNLSEWFPHAKDRSDVRAMLGLEDDVFAFITVGRADPQKDYDNLIAAFERASRLEPRLRLVIIGRGTERLAIPDRIRAATMVLGERSDVPLLLRGMDGLCLASAYGEGFPNVIGEAMATGLPCVVTQVGDAAAIVGSAGIAVPPRSPDELADGLLRLARLPIAARHALNPRARIEDNFDIATVGRRYRKLFDELIG